MLVSSDPVLTTKLTMKVSYAEIVPPFTKEPCDLEGTL